MLKKNEQTKVCKLLNQIISHELVGVIKYTHFSIMVTGSIRPSLESFFKQQATESLTHAQLAGELLTNFNAYPVMNIQHIIESHSHDVEKIIHESIKHEEMAIKQYFELFNIVKEKSIYLEEYARGMISKEEMHALEMRKMLKHFK